MCRIQVFYLWNSVALIGSGNIELSIQKLEGNLKLISLMHIQSDRTSYQVLIASRLARRLIKFLSPIGMSLFSIEDRCSIEFRTLIKVQKRRTHKFVRGFPVFSSLIQEYSTVFISEIYLRGNSNLVGRSFPLDHYQPLSRSEQLGRQSRRVQRPKFLSQRNNHGFKFRRT